MQLLCVVPMGSLRATQALEAMVVVDRAEWSVLGINHHHHHVRQILKHRPTLEHQEHQPTLQWQSNVASVIVVRKDRGDLSREQGYAMAEYMEHVVSEAIIQTDDIEKKSYGTGSADLEELRCLVGRIKDSNGTDRKRNVEGWRRLDSYQTAFWRTRVDARRDCSSRGISKGS